MKEWLLLLFIAIGGCELTCRLLLLSMLATFGLNYIRRRYYSVVAKSIAYRKTRWAFTLGLLAVYFYRVSGLSYDVITYLIGFYLLQLLVSYLTPRGFEDAELDFEDEEDPQVIATLETEILMQENFEIQEDPALEGKPLVSSLSQSDAWERITFAFILGLCCTLFKQMEVDVFWPLLMVYFVVLVSYTIHKIVKKMQKYKYTLSDFNKKPTSI